MKEGRNKTQRVQENQIVEVLTVLRVGYSCEIIHPL
jgi:hypothetical protein